MGALQVGDTLYSPFFGREIVIAEIISDHVWKFEVEGMVVDAQTPLSYFEQRPELKVKRNDVP